MKIELGPITSGAYNEADLLEELAGYLDEEIIGRPVSLTLTDSEKNLVNEAYVTICEAQKAIKTVRDGEATDWQDRDEIGNAYQAISELIDEVVDHINDAETDNPFLVFAGFADGNSTYGWMLNDYVVECAFQHEDHVKLTDGRIVSECGHVKHVNDHGNTTITTVDGDVVVAAV
jgi:hypothetical protein